MTLEPIADCLRWKYGFNFNRAFGFIKSMVQDYTKFRGMTYEQVMEEARSKKPNPKLDFEVDASADEFWAEIRKRFQETDSDKRLRSQRERNLEFIIAAEQELPVLKPSLKSIIDFIRTEKPDYVVFLDKGARMYGVPMHKYLKTLDLEKMPKIKFYNDDWLKTAEQEGMLTKEVVDSEFSRYKGKKVLFVDEFVFEGKTTCVMKQAAELSDDVDLHYFGLCRADIDTLVVIYRGIVNRYENINDKRIAISPLKQKAEPFTYKASHLYVKECPDKDGCVTVSSLSAEEKDYMFGGLVPREVKQERYQAVKHLQGMIYQTLMELPR